VSNPRVVVIVLCWNGVEDTLECLASLRAVDYPGFRTIVVDNGSSDGTPAIVRSSFPGVELIETGENLGFAGGNNVGICRAMDGAADAVLLLNNDTTVAPDFLSELVEAMYRSDRVAAANPTIYYYDEPDVIWAAGGAVDLRTGVASQRCIGETDSAERADEEEVDYCVGTAILMRREAVETVGLLDPAYFLYYEETDWCFRARDAGYRCIYVPTARVWHKISRGFDGNAAAQLYYFCRNRLLFLRRRGAGWGRLMRATGDLARMSAAMALRGDRVRSRAVLNGLADFHRGRFGALASRPKVPDLRSET